MFSPRLARMSLLAVLAAGSLGSFAFATAGTTRIKAPTPARHLAAAIKPTIALVGSSARGLGTGAAAVAAPSRTRGRTNAGLVPRVTRISQIATTRSPGVARSSRWWHPLPRTTGRMRPGQ